MVPQRPAPKTPIVTRLFLCALTSLGLWSPLVAAPAGEDRAPAAASQASNVVTHKAAEREADPRDRQRYWFERRARISAPVLDRAIDSARRLPRAEALPGRNGLAEKALPIGGSPWVSFGPAPIVADADSSGRVRTLAIDPVMPSTIYAGAATGGVWKSGDAGSSWTPMSNESSQPTLSMGSIAIDPTNHNVIYAGTGEHFPDGTVAELGKGVLKSTDGGATWVLLPPSACATLPTNRLLVGPTGTVWVACAAGLNRSTDGGMTWTRLNSTEVTDVAMSADGRLLYGAVINAGLYRSQDGGFSWAAVHSPNLPAASAWSAPARIAIAPSNSNVAYVILDPIQGNAFFTADGGTTWNAMPDSGTLAGATYGGYNLEIAVDPLDANLVYVGGQYLIYSTGGTTGGGWTQGPAWGHVDQHAIVFPSCSSSPCSLYLGNDGGVFYLQGGRAATAAITLNSKLTLAQFVGGDIGWDFANDAHAIGGTQDNGTVLFIRSNPPYSYAPLSWSRVLGGDGGFAYLGQNQNNTSLAYTEEANPTGYLACNAFQCTGPWQNENWGFPNNWSSLGTGLLGLSAVFYPFYTLDREDDQHLAFAAGTGVYEYMAGTGWFASNDLNLTTAPRSIAIAPCASSVIYAALFDGSVYRTMGAHSGAASRYKRRSGGLPADSSMSINSLAVDCSDPATYDAAFLAAAANSATPEQVWKTVDGGVTWVNISGNLPPGLPAHSIVTYRAGATRVLVIGTDAGVFFSTNDGQSWAQFNNGLPALPVTQLALDHNQTTIAAFTYGRGAFSTSISGPACTYAITPASQSFPSGGGTGSVAVTAPTGCSWNASSGASWVTVTSGGSGAGNGTVTYSVAPNSGVGPQSTTLTIAGQAFTVNEAAGSCSGTLAPTAKGFTPQGGSSSVAVTASCAWTAASGASWITITAGGSGTGSGTVFYGVAANTTTSSRAGTLSIAGQTFTVMQAGGITAASATASSTYTGSSPAFAIDGDTGTFWNSGTYAPSSIDLDLGATYSVTKVRLNVAQLPSGSTTHEIWGGPSLASLTLLQTLTGVTSSGQWLESPISPAAANVRFVRIRTTSSPSWVAWSEVEVYGTPSLGPGTNLLQNGDFETGVLAPWFKYPKSALGIVGVESCCANQTPGGTWDAYIEPMGQYVEMTQQLPVQSSPGPGSVTPGRTYHLQAIVSTNQGMEADLWYYTDVSSNVKCASTTVTWPTVATLQCTFTVPAGTTSFNVHLSATSGKWVVTDSWSLTDVTN